MGLALVRWLPPESPIGGPYHVRQRENEIQMQPTIPPHINAGRMIRMFGWLTSIPGVALIASVIIPVVTHGDASNTAKLLALSLLGSILLAIGLGQLVLGSAIKKHKDWSRIGGIVYGVLLLFLFPVGTVIGALILHWLIKGWDELPIKLVEPPAAADS